MCLNVLSLGLWWSSFIPLTQLYPASRVSSSQTHPSAVCGLTETQIHRQPEVQETQDRLHLTVEGPG